MVEIRKLKDRFPQKAKDNEFDVATPEYSKIANRNGPDTVSDTVIVFAPPLMFSA